MQRKLEHTPQNTDEQKRPCKNVSDLKRIPIAY